MTHRFARFADTEDGNAMIDWLVLVTGVVLMTVSIVVAVVPRAADISDDGATHAPSVDANHPV